MQHKVNFKQNLTGLKWEFSFSSTCCDNKVKEPNLPYYLPIVTGKIVWFIIIPEVSVLCEMKTALDLNSSNCANFPQW